MNKFLLLIITIDKHLLEILILKTGDIKDFCSPDVNFLEVINLNNDDDFLNYFYDFNKMIENDVQL